jgi:hypothetical protein
MCTYFHEEGRKAQIDLVMYQLKYPPDNVAILGTEKSRVLARPNPVINLREVVCRVREDKDGCPYVFAMLES